MQRLCFPVIPRRKLEMWPKNTYMAKDGRFCQLVKLYVQFCLRGFSEKFKLFQTAALRLIYDHTLSYIDQMKGNYI
jgi:hypothetical protein